jgi:sugar (pentulose or hexulose) kinase
MEPECILAIDLGTSGPKVALADSNYNRRFSFALYAT